MSPLSRRLKAGVLSATLAASPAQADITLKSGVIEPLISVPAPLPLKSETPSAVKLQIRPSVDTGETTTLTLQRLQDFEASVDLRVRTDPALVPSDRLIEMVESIGMVDGKGRTITDGYDIDAAHDVVVGLAGASVQITKVIETDQGQEIWVLVKDRQGQIITPPKGSLAAYTTGGERLCYSEESAQERQRKEAAANGGLLPLAFAVLVDSSGSMAGVMEEVKSSALSFVDQLPDKAMCLVGGFSDSETFLKTHASGFNACKPEDFDLSGLKAGGQTDIYGPLQEVYELADNVLPAHYQRAVIVITDGLANQNLEALERVREQKGGTVAFFYLLGEKKSAAWVRELADNYLEHDGDLSVQLPRYLEVVSDAYRKQTVLRLTQCPAKPQTAKHFKWWQLDVSPDAAR